MFPFAARFRASVTEMFQFVAKIELYNRPLAFISNSSDLTILSVGTYEARFANDVKIISYLFGDWPAYRQARAHNVASGIGALRYLVSTH